MRVTSGSESVDGGQDFFGMPVYADAAPFLADDALLVDQEGRAVDPHGLLTVPFPFDPNAIAFAQLAVDVETRVNGSWYLALNWS